MAKKNTLVAWSDLGASSYAAVKTRGLAKNVSAIQDGLGYLNEVGKANLGATFAVYELLAAQGEELRELSFQMRDYNDTLMRIENHLMDQKEQEIITGKRRVMVLGIMKEVEHIKGLMETYPEFAALKLEHLREFIEDNQICITNFQHTSFDELTRIDEVLSSVENLYHSIVSSLDNGG